MLFTVIPKSRILGACCFRFSARAEDLKSITNKAAARQEGHQRWNKGLIMRTISPRVTLMLLTAPTGKIGVHRWSEEGWKVLAGGF